MREHLLFMGKQAVRMVLLLACVSIAAFFLVSVSPVDPLQANVGQAERWLRLAGCQEVFHVSSYTGEGIWRILEYLREPGDVLPWDNEAEAEQQRKVLSTKR